MRMLYGILLLMVIGCGENEAPPSGIRLVLKLDLAGLAPAEAQATVEQALAVIGRRAEHLPLALPSQGILEGVASLVDLIGRFGEKPAILYQQADSQITVDLPTAEDVQRAQRLLSKVGLLEFQLLVPIPDRDRTLARLDALLGGRDAVDTGSAEKTRDLFEAPSRQAEEVADQSLLSLLTPRGEDLVFPAQALARIQTLLGDQRALLIIDEDKEFLFSNKPEEDATGRFYTLYLVYKRTEMTGDALENTSLFIRQDEPNAGQPEIEFTTTAEGTRRLARMTGAHIGQRLALVVDGAVYAAPMIQSPISGGKGRITDHFTVEEAMELAVVLRTGALPCPVRVVSAGPIEPQPQ